MSDLSQRSSWSGPLDAQRVEGVTSIVDGDPVAAALQAGAAATVRTDPDRRQRLLENPFRNAVGHGGRDVTFTVGDRPDGSHVAADGGARFEITGVESA